MPDHLHLFIQPRGNKGEPLREWVKYWKRTFSKTHGFGVSNPFWQKNYWESNVRGANSYSNKWMYVRENPVRKKLVDHTDQWPFQGTIEQLTLED